MSGGGRRVFLPELRELEAGLSVPLPTRLRVLEELEADLDALRRRLEGRGMSAEEAQAHALDALLPDREVLERLGRVHAPLYRRLTHGIRGDVLRRAERLALLTATIGLVLAGALTLTRVGLFQNPSPFFWPVLGLGGGLIAAVIAKAFRLWVSGDHRDPSEGLGLVLGLSCAVLMAGCVGVFVDLYRLAAVLETAPGEVLGPFLTFLQQDAALLTFALTLALAGALCWFALSWWVVQMGAARARVLGMPAGPGPAAAQLARSHTRDPHPNHGGTR